MTADVLVLIGLGTLGGVPYWMIRKMRMPWWHTAPFFFIFAASFGLVGLLS